MSRQEHIILYSHRAQRLLKLRWRDINFEKSPRNFLLPGSSTLLRQRVAQSLHRGSWPRKMSQAINVKIKEFRMIPKDYLRRFSYIGRVVQELKKK
jgi:hypothetical protein